MEIGLIGEGVTDHVTIENILYGYFQGKDILVKPLQPKPNEAGNWDKVFKYCHSEEFKQSLPFNDIVIVQVDTDFLRTGDVPEDLSKLSMAIKDMDTLQIIEAVKQQLIEKMGVDFYEENSGSIHFAIAVDQIECWLLPIYYDNKPKTANKTVGCMDALNKALSKREGFTIYKKEVRYYDTIAKIFRKRDKLLALSSKNPSFEVFINELDSKITQ